MKQSDDSFAVMLEVLKDRGGSIGQAGYIIGNTCGLATAGEIADLITCPEAKAKADKLIGLAKAGLDAIIHSDRRASELVVSIYQKWHREKQIREGEPGEAD